MNSSVSNVEKYCSWCHAETKILKSNLPKSPGWSKSSNSLEDLQRGQRSVHFHDAADILTDDFRSDKSIDIFSKLCLRWNRTQNTGLKEAQNVLFRNGDGSKFQNPESEHEVG